MENINVLRQFDDNNMSIVALLNSRYKDIIEMLYRSDIESTPDFHIFFICYVEDSHKVYCRNGDNIEIINDEKTYIDTHYGIHLDKYYQFSTKQFGIELQNKSTQTVLKCSAEILMYYKIENEQSTPPPPLMNQINGVFLGRSVGFLSKDAEYSSLFALEANSIIEMAIVNLTSQNLSHVYIDVNDISVIKNISAQFYEGKKSVGSIFFYNDGDFDGLRFTNHIEFKHSESRRLRKLLEITKEKPLLLKQNHDDLVASFSAVGIGYVQHGLLINITGHLEWEMLVGSNIIVKYSEGEYRLPQRGNKILDSLIDVLGIDKTKAVELCDLFNLASEHGTTILITDALESIENLCNAQRGVSCNPIDLLENGNKSLFKHLTSIDGAIVLSKEGKCYAIGVILDGKTVIEGTTARGARYNSVANYIAWKQKEDAEHTYYAIIISEDGSKDIKHTQQKFIILPDA